MGYDANKGKMVKAGIVDPLKVVRTADRERGQHCRPFLTTETMGRTIEDKSNYAVVKMGLMVFILSHFAGSLRFTPR